MESLAGTLQVLAIIAVVVVAVVLVLGMVSMAVGGKINERWGNRLMQLRVITQGVAIALLAGLAAITLSQNG
jgi:MFS family permease